MSSKSKTVTKKVILSVGQLESVKYKLVQVPSGNWYLTWEDDIEIIPCKTVADAVQFIKERNHRIYMEKNVPVISEVEFETSCKEGMEEVNKSLLDYIGNK